MPDDQQTRLNRMQRDLHANEPLFCGLVLSSPDATLIVDKSGNVCFFNPAAEALFGCDAKQLLNQPFGFPVVAGETAKLDIRRSDGMNCVAELRAEELTWEDQPAFVAILRDITEQQQILSELTARTRLAELSSAVNQALTDAVDIQSLLQRCSEAMAESSDAAAVRIWTVSQGETMLELQASAGQYTHQDDAHRQIQIGEFGIGLIAKERKTLFTNQVVGDSCVGDQQWAQREGIVAFAGYPLIVDGELLGVMALFAKHELNADTLEALESAANAVAAGIRHKRTEIVLRDAERRFRATIEAAPTAMMMVNENGRIILVNQETEKLFGYNREELLGQPVEMLVPERFRSGHPAHRAVYSKNPTPRPMGKGRELFGLRKDGSEIPVELGLNPVHTEEGQFVLSAIVDISERKLAELRLHQANETLRKQHAIRRTLYDKSSNFIGLLSPDGKLLDANRTSLEASGVLFEDVQNLPFWETPWWTHSEKDQERLKQAIETASGGKSDGFEATHPTPNGEFLYVDFTIEPVRDDQGNVIYLIPEGRDVTLHKQRETQLKQLVKKVKSSNTELEQFAYAASHDLQEPLRKVTSFGELLATEVGEKLEGDSAKYLHYVIDGADRMRVLIQDLLQFSRIGSDVEKFSDTSVADAVREAIRNLETSIEEAVAEVTYDELPVVRADRRQLIQLFQNLIGNAIKYRGDKAPVIRATSESVDDHWVFTVSDNGIGIEPKCHERVFGIFKRLHTRSEYSGTGIGLAICRRIVERMGGRIWVESELGKGSSFRFTIKKPSSTKDHGQAIHS